LLDFFENGYPRVEWASSESLPGAQDKMSLPHVLNTPDFYKLFEVHTEAKDFVIDGCWCKIDIHCI
jgi:hypothetical protein